MKRCSEMLNRDVERNSYLCSQWVNHSGILVVKIQENRSHLNCVPSPSTARRNLIQPGLNKIQRLI